MIDFEHRSAIKSQALADFIADWTLAAFDTMLQFDEPTWTVHCDEAWGMSGARISTSLTPPNRSKLHYAARLTTTNIAKYEAILLGLRKLRALGLRTCIVKSNS